MHQDICIPKIKQNMTGIDTSNPHVRQPLDNLNVVIPIPFSSLKFFAHNFFLWRRKITSGQAIVRGGRTDNLTIYLIWPDINKLCVKFYLSLIQDKTQTRIKRFTEWPITCPNDLGSDHDTSSVISNLCVWRKNFQYFSIRKIWTEHKFCTFSVSELELA